MQRRGSSDPLTPLGKWLLAGWLLIALLAVLRYTAGGWRGLLHHRLRGPLMATTCFAASAAWGRWLAAQQGRTAAMGAVLLVCSLVALAVGVVVTYSRFISRWEASARIASELTDLLDDGLERFHVAEDNAHRPLELLEELTELLGPGGWAPGYPWATQRWIADHIPEALSLKQRGIMSRIEKHRS